MTDKETETQRGVTSQKEAKPASDPRVSNLQVSVYNKMAGTTCESVQVFVVFCLVGLGFSFIMTSILPGLLRSWGVVGGRSVWIQT